MFHEGIFAATSNAILTLRRSLPDPYYVEIVTEQFRTDRAINSGVETASRNNISIKFPPVVTLDQ